MTIDEQIFEMQKAGAQLQRTWNEKVQPKLARDPRLPAQFVIDVANTLVQSIIQPVDELQSEVTTANRLSSVGAVIVGLGGNSAANLFPQAAAIVKARTQAVAERIDFIFERVLTPLAQEARLAITREGSKATIAVVTSGADRLDQVVLTTIAACINAIRELSTIQEIARGNPLFRIAEFGVNGAKALVGAFSALGTAIATVGMGFYNLFRTLFFVAKVALIGGAAYVGYRLYQSARSPSPTSNPGRRRARAYLR